jgi:PAS domain S-box-containing protein
MMLNYFHSLFLTDFMPHGFCMRWQSDVMGLHVVSDALIVLAYVSIPFLLYRVVRKRRDIPFSWMFLAFGAFILACGATHAMSIVTLWQPVYRTEGLVKAITALASVATAICLWRLLPVLVKIPSEAKLREAIQLLRTEIIARNAVEATLQISRDELTKRVAEQTMELSTVNEILCEREEETRKLNDQLELRVGQRTSELRESEDRYRTLLENIKDYSILMLDTRGCVLSWNSSAQRLKQYTADEIIGKHFSCFYPPEDVAAGVPEGLLKTSAKEGHIEHEGWRLRKDGTRFWGLVMITALRDESGALRGFTKMTRDVSERKRSEEMLQAQTSKLKEQAALLDLAHDAIIVREAGAGSKIVFWNSGAVETYGYQREGALGRSSHDLLRTSFPEQLDRIEAEVSRTGRWEGELVHTPLGGVAITVASRWALQRDDHGQPESILEINRNISAQKAVERDLHAANDQLESANVELKTFSRKLEASNHELQDFASVAAHDLQEPLRKVRAFGDRLKTIFLDANLEDAARDYLDRMLKATSRMQALINDLLSFSRVTSQAHAFERVDLFRIAQEVLYDLEESIAATGAVVELEGLPTVQADATQMRQLLQNLIGNSLKFHKPGEPSKIRIHGALTSASGASDGVCQLVVEDNGIGFDEKYLDRIFTVFQRLHSRTEYEGTGVGLAICRKIVHRHGGEITARSAPNEGAAFLVTLPCHAVALPEQAGRLPGIFSGSGEDDEAISSSPGSIGAVTYESRL